MENELIEFFDHHKKEKFTVQQIMSELQIKYKYRVYRPLYQMVKFKKIKKDWKLVNSRMVQVFWRER